MQESNHQGIRVRAVPSCYVCGSIGNVLYKNLNDKLFGSLGEWGLSKCSKCDLVWLNPMPIEKDIGKAYLNYYTHQNSKSNTRLLDDLYQRIQKVYAARKYGYKVPAHSWVDYILATLIDVHPGRRIDAAFKAFYLPAIHAGKLLEVGCGNGSMLSAMNELGWESEGVDFDPNAVKVARASGLKVQLGSIKDGGYQNDSFDAIVMSHVIEHVPDPRDLLRECYRILKVGGRLIVVTPNAQSWGHKLYSDNWRGLEPPRHLQIFSRKSLGALAVQAGFVGAECKSTVRGARGMFLACMELERINLEDKKVAFSAYDMLKVEAMEIAEAIALNWNADLGEELILSIIKSDQA